MSQSCVDLTNKVSKSCKEPFEVDQLPNVIEGNRAEISLQKDGTLILKYSDHEPEINEKIKKTIQPIRRRVISYTSWDEHALNSYQLETKVKKLIGSHCTTSEVTESDLSALSSSFQLCMSKKRSSCDCDDPAMVAWKRLVGSNRESILIPVETSVSARSISSLTTVDTSTSEVDLLYSPL